MTSTMCILRLIRDRRGATAVSGKGWETGAACGAGGGGARRVADQNFLGTEIDEGYFAKQKQKQKQKTDRSAACQVSKMRASTTASNLNEPLTAFSDRQSGILKSDDHDGLDCQEDRRCVLLFFF